MPTDTVPPITYRDLNAYRQGVLESSLTMPWWLTAKALTCFVIAFCVTINCLAGLILWQGWLRFSVQIITPVMPLLLLLMIFKLRRDALTMLGKQSLESPNV